jgi:hypothetical protein
MLQPLPANSLCKALLIAKQMLTSDMLKLEKYLLESMIYSVSSSVMCLFHFYIFVVKYIRQNLPF